MSSTPTLPVVLAAPVTLSLPDGRRFHARPLSLSVLTAAMERLIEERLTRLGLPAITEALKLTAEQSGESQAATLRTLAQLREQACRVTLDEVLSWMLTNPANMVEAVLASIVGDDRPTQDDVFRALLHDLKQGNRFVDRWLEVGFNENPTSPPSEQSSGD